jgi:putative phage-type endonuclease
MPKYLVMSPLIERSPPFLEFENLWVNLVQMVGLEVVQSITSEQWMTYYTNIHKTLNRIPTLSQEQIQQRIQTLDTYRKKLQILQQIPKMQQRTEEWYSQRRNMLTASDLASILNKSKFATRKAVLQKKVEEIQNNGTTFNASAPPLKWGVMYEPVALRCYLDQRGNVSCHDFGLIAHPNSEIPFGASPDGITEHGIMVELKCPYKRVIEHGTVPEQYYLQIQGQLEVCNLDECDYVECVIEELFTTTEYLQGLENVKQHGAVLEWVNEHTKETSYEYSQSGLTGMEVVTWSECHAERRMEREPELQLVAIHYWRLKDMNLVRVYRDTVLWNSIEQEIKDFWNEVKTHRENGTLPPKSTRSYSKEGKEPKKMKIEFRQDD